MKSIPTLTAIVTTLVLAVLIPVTMASDGGDKAAVCAGCHGLDGHSVVPDNPILAAQHADYLSGALQAYISGERDNGIMKTMAGRLSARDMADLSAYYASQPPHQSQARAAGDAVRGEGKIAACAACHGPAGRSVNPMFPNLAGQHAVYLSRALTDYRSGARRSNPMSRITETLSDEDIEDIAAYYAAQAAQ
jgi:cytochrome c553